MQAGDAVYHIAAGEACCHVDLAALYYGVACDASAVSAELLAEDGAPALFISLIISNTRGSRLWTRPWGQVSSASDMMVWLV